MRARTSVATVTLLGMLAACGGEETDYWQETSYRDAAAASACAPLLRILLRHGVAFDDARAIGQLVSGIPRCDAVRRAYIRMERSSHDAFLDYWPHVAICTGAFQIALGLWQGGSISDEGVARVASGLREEGHTPAALGERLARACRQGLVERGRAVELAARLSGRGLIADGGRLPEVAPEWAARARVDPNEPWTPRRLRGS